MFGLSTPAIRRYSRYGAACNMGTAISRSMGRCSNVPSSRRCILNNNKKSMAERLAGGCQQLDIPVAYKVQVRLDYIAGLGNCMNNERRNMACVRRVKTHVQLADND